MEATPTLSPLWPSLATLPAPATSVPTAIHHACHLSLLEPHCIGLRGPPGMWWPFLLPLTYPPPLLYPTDTQDRPLPHLTDHRLYSANRTVGCEVHRLRDMAGKLKLKPSQREYGGSHRVSPRRPGWSRTHRHPPKCWDQRWQAVLHPASLGFDSELDCIDQSGLVHWGSEQMCSLGFMHVQPTH